MSRTITNFGGNIRFTPPHHYTPRSESDVLAILHRHAGGSVRAVGSLHSWSPLVCTDDAIVDLRHFQSVTITRNAQGEPIARVGGGCRIRHLLRRLHANSHYTLPSIGLITQQTIAGAIATGTHGSGKHSISHYVVAVRIAAYTGANGSAEIVEVNSGDELRVAR